MLKRFFKKWRLWEDALLGIDDLQEDYLLGLEKRIARLEATVVQLNNAPGEANRREDGRAIPKL